MKAGFIKDIDCARGTPLTCGNPRESIYGAGIRKKPAIIGRQESKYDRQIYLDQLLPLEEYDLIVVLFSGGKDSMAAYWVLREFGVPKERIELWHHDIDGGHPYRTMDWPVTQSYNRAFAEAEGLTLRTSWRVNGFFGELYRIGASYPVEFEDGQRVVACRLSDKQRRSEELREKTLATLDERSELRSFGYRMKFPAKSGDLARRWCSAYLKIDVADMVIRNLNMENIKVLVVSGERRGESAGRAKYNEIELHRTNATAKAKRLVHQWRPVIDYSERDVWEVLRRHGITPHPCYSAGWNRCSCMMCIFSLPRHWAGIKELFPEQYEAMRQDEITLGFTIDNKKNLDEYTGDAVSCVSHSDERALRQLRAGQFTKEDIYTPARVWEFPAGAFKGADGGPC
jgi:3'-phosphoadenosine 5'-phosphosulfate sulfotransferase (PAPS reductase)/FAD synthetase